MKKHSNEEVGLRVRIHQCYAELKEQGLAPSYNQIANLFRQKFPDLYQDHGENWKHLYLIDLIRTALRVDDNTVVDLGEEDQMKPFPGMPKNAPVRVHVPQPAGRVVIYVRLMSRRVHSAVSTSCFCGEKVMRITPLPIVWTRFGFGGRA